MSELPAQTRRVVEAGRALYGDHWQTPLARAAGVSSSSIADLIAKPPASRRTLTPVMAKRIATALSSEVKRLGGARAEVKRLHAEIIANIETE